MTELEWIISNAPVDYPDAVTAMEQRIAAIKDGSASEAIWLLEHPPLFTAGTSAQAHDLLSPRFPVYQAGRGGQYTYHGPGQLVAYVMINLKQRQSQPDIKQFVWSLEEWIIQALARFGIEGYRIDGRVGIWVQDSKNHVKKIAAIGVRVRHWVTYHGISINLNPDLSHFNDIVPCGIADAGVTSFDDLGIEATRDELQKVLQETCIFSSQS